MDVAGNLATVRQRIAAAAARVGRDAATVKLLAVTKTMPVEVINEAYRAGQVVMAENRVQEWRTKVDLLPADCEWHLIGRLQTNKVKYLDHRVKLIHSLDRPDLLRVLEEQGAKKDLIWQTLVQVNIGDPAKAGLDPAEVEDFLDLIPDHPHIRVAGLMTIGMLGAGPQETRGFFRQLRVLRDNLRRKDWPGVTLNELSMGMSNDFESAVEEGSTMVRVGRHIFGERQEGKETI